MYSEGFAGKKGYISTFERGLQAIYTPLFCALLLKIPDFVLKKNLQETLL
jgi:hypothetical protein